jgi:hypothetical protein
MAVLADSEMIVGDGTTDPVAESGATLRTSIGCDPIGTDNSTPVSLAGTPNYITLAGQVITRALINLTSHITGVLPVANGGTGTSSAILAWSNLDTFNTTGSSELGENTSIPSTCVAIKLVFRNVSLDGTGDIEIELGDATAYSTNSTTTTNQASSTSVGDWSGGPYKVVRAAVLTDRFAGTSNMTKIASTHSWIGDGMIQEEISTEISNSVGRVTLDAGTALTRVRVTSTANNFDAGEVNLWILS